MLLRDTMQFLPLGLSIASGLIAGCAGANGWKWGCITLFFVLAAIVTAADPVTGGKLFLAIAVITVIAIGVRSARGRMALTNMGRRAFLIPAITLISVAAAAYVMPALADLQEIASTRDQFDVEHSINTELVNNSLQRPPEVRPSVDDVLDPPFLQHYGLSTRNLPTGNDWVKWRLRTKVAAIVYFYDRRRFSAFEINRIIKHVDFYFSVNARDALVYDAVGGAIRLESLTAQKSQQGRGGF